MKNSNTLKQLQVQLSKLQSDYESLKPVVTRGQQALTLKKQQISELREKIQKYQTSSEEIIVSEHAILRYIERVKGINIEEIKKEILTPQLEQMIQTLGGNGSYPLENCTVKMQDNVITTITINKKHEKLA